MSAMIWFFERKKMNACAEKMFDFCLIDFSE